MSPNLRVRLAKQLVDASPMHGEGPNRITALLAISGDTETPPLVSIEAHRAAWAAVLEEVEAAGGSLTGHEDVKDFLKSVQVFPRAAKALERWSVGTSSNLRGDNQRRQHGNE